MPLSQIQLNRTNAHYNTRWSKERRVLITGWFSFEGMGTTAGDLMAKDVLCQWLKNSGIDFKVAVANMFDTGESINWQTCNPQEFSDLIFLCGPFGNGWPLTELLERFAGVNLIGVNLSVLQNLDEWNPFTILYERDSSRASNPDITFYASPPKVPVVGVVLVHKQKEYGNRAMHHLANSAIENLTAKVEASIVNIDTALENNKSGLRTAGEVESLIARMDLIITTRLHGTVLALKNGVPVIPIDPISGGAKISTQVKTVEWPVLFTIDNLDADKLLESFHFCLTEEAKLQARECSVKSINKVERLREDLIVNLTAR